MAQLNGFKIKISWLGADHTYVTSSDGYIWPCWGRSAGGKLISSGQGSSARANCLSQSDSHAGIVYGVTGVCHQTSNRILFPAGITVSSASGYWASVLLYGVYGTHSAPALIEWEIRKVNCSRISGDRAIALPLRAAASAAASKPVAPQSAEERAFLDKVNEMHASHVKTMTVRGMGEIKHPDFLARELDIMADYKLGKAKDPKQIKSLQNFQADAVKEKNELVLALNKRKIDGEEYANKVNDLLVTLLNNCSKTVSEDHYVRLFGMKRGAAFGIVDPKIMAKLNR